MEYPLYGRLNYRINRFFKKLSIIIVTSPLVAVVPFFPAWIMGKILRKRGSIFFRVWCITLVIECFIFIMKYPFGPYIWLADEGLYVAKGKNRVLVPWVEIRNVEEYVEQDGQRGIRLTFDDAPLWKIKGSGWSRGGTYSFDYCYDITPGCGSNYYRGDEPAGYYDGTGEEECECDSREEHTRFGMPHYLFIPDIFSTSLDDIYQRMMRLWRGSPEIFLKR